MNRHVLLLVVVLLIVVFMSLVKANQEQGREDITNILKYSTTVELHIEGDDDIENIVYSYFSREIRSLGDVRVVKKNGDWKIDTIVIQNTLTGGRHIGFIITTVVTKRFRLRDYGDKQILFDGRINENDYKLLEKLTDNLFWFNNQWILTGGTNDLQYLCQKTIAEFDIQHLKPEREARQRIINEAKLRIKKIRDEKRKNIK